MKCRVLVKDLCKTFPKYKEAGNKHTLRYWLTKKMFRSAPEERVQVLSGVNFSLTDGEVLGIIGRNGAGKSTLLNLVGGVGLPDSGVLEIDGRLGALLELGAGIQPSLSGRESVILGGIIAGMTRSQVVARMDEIVSFAELEGYINNPLRTYSTGMQMRLAFSTIVHSDPAILLVDEVLSVGDIAFQQKCLAKIRALQEAGCAFLLATHDLSQVEDICHRVMWIDEGRVVDMGTPIEIIQAYRAKMANETRRRTPPPEVEATVADEHVLVLQKNRLGSQEIQIKKVDILDMSGRSISEIVTGHSMQVRIHYETNVPVTTAIFGVSISDKEGHTCLEVSTAAENDLPTEMTGAAILVLELFHLDMRKGQYFVNVGVYENNWSYAYDYHWHVYPIQVLPTSSYVDHRTSPHRWKFL